MIRFCRENVGLLSNAKNGGMLVYLRLLSESFHFALQALKNNKLRTFLSLLGVTIGIFSIIAVLSAVDSLDAKFKKDLSALDKNTAFLLRFPFGPSDIPQWKLEQFPDVKYDEYVYLKSSLNTVEDVAFQVWAPHESIKYEGETAKEINTVPISYEFANIQKLDFEEGRFYNEAESNSGSPVVVLGYEVVQKLFGGSSPIGKQVRMYGQRFTVIGVLKKQGKGLFGDSNDTSAFLPVNYIRHRYGDNAASFTPVILMKPKADVEAQEFKGEVSQKMRLYRGIKPGDIDNFFVNILAGFAEALDQVIGVLNLVGWIIAGFSLLVGGFGIANIMFVSVKERTHLIGIQKSLGAKNRFILMQFLFESVILCLFGGAIGLLMVWGTTVILTKALEFEFVLSLYNVFFGTFLAVFIGLISGIVPALMASRLDPVEAIRTGI